MNKIKEIIYKREVEQYDQRIQSKQKELESLQGDAHIQIQNLEVEAKKIKVHFEETGLYERFEKVKDERKTNKFVLPPQLIIPD